MTLSATSGAVEGDPAAPERFRNRELSWLDFNERVLTLADDENVPVLERAKFLAIFSQNLDEFFQVRVAGLKDQVASSQATGQVTTSPDGRTPSQQLRAIRDRLTTTLLPRMEAIFLDKVAPALADAGIRFSSWHELDEDDEMFLVETFEQRIFPVLTPLAVDPGHPFPYISNLSLNLAVVLRDSIANERRFARVKVPSLLPRFVVMPDGERYVPLEQVIAAHLGELFPGMEIEQHHTFRVTRNADLTLEEEEADDLLAAVEVELRRRRFGRSVRLEVDAAMTPEVRQLLQRELDLADEDVYVHVAPLDLGGLWAVHALDRPDLKDPPYKPVTPARLAPDDDRHDRHDAIDIFAAIRKGDILVHHPYESFSASVEQLVRKAAVDPHVLAIKMTLYRTSGDSPIVKSLIRAAEDGKQVAVLVELKARFDEGANIEWARALETAGVHVAYGLIGLKVHAKTLLVVRDEADGLRRYCHVGTGNYNPTTAGVYEDLGLLTCDPAIGNELTQLFNELTGYGRNVRYDRLVLAPRTLRGCFIELIRQEAAAARRLGGGDGAVSVSAAGDGGDDGGAGSLTGDGNGDGAAASVRDEGDGDGAAGGDDGTAGQGATTDGAPAGRAGRNGGSAGSAGGTAGSPGSAAPAPSPGRIILKMNALADAELIDELYAASEAGVQIDVIVRGICCLVPGVPGQSENIRVRSIVGRYLEHSRIYYFANGNGPGDPRYLIGSADLMPRNLDRRVEALVAVDEPALQARLRQVLDIELEDDVLAWELDARGMWHRLPGAADPDGGNNTHRRLQQLSLARSPAPARSS